MNNPKTIYSVFSGTFYEIPEKDLPILNIGQVPLVKKPSTSCKKCYGKGHNGRDLISFAFQVCSCVRKNIDFNVVKKIVTDLNT
jgi:hypothetical protein